MAMKTVLLVASLILVVTSGCAVVRLTADPEGHITSATYVGLIRRYEASYHFTTADGKAVITQTNSIGQGILRQLAQCA
jgi:hypothetical protein